jgi:hypothetical protein
MCATALDVIADTIDKQVFMIINSNNSIDVFGFATYLGSNGRPATGTILGNLTLFEGAFALNTPYTAHWVPFVEK